MRKLKKVALLLMACYCIAYGMVAAIESHTLKNDHEQKTYQLYKELD